MSSKILNSEGPPLKFMRNSRFTKKSRKKTEVNLQENVPLIFVDCTFS